MHLPRRRRACGRAVRNFPGAGVPLGWSREPHSTVTLTGKYVVLEPLSQVHHDGLVDAARDGELWRLWYTAVPAPEMAAEIDRRLRCRSGVHAAVHRSTGGSCHRRAGPVIGMTTYMNIDPVTPRVEIGSTWNAASAHAPDNPDSTPAAAARV